ncbi:MAG: hypothetical protein AB9M53_01800 [Leptothrix sp. (in: b-proteobacteria)]
MTSHSMTFSHVSPLDGVITRVSTLVAQAAHAAYSWLNSPSNPEPQTAAELLVWAKQFEDTEPGYAADLRAAALRAME